MGADGGEKKLGHGRLPLRALFPGKRLLFLWRAPFSWVGKGPGSALDGAKIPQPHLGRAGPQTQDIEGPARWLKARKTSGTG